MNLIETHCHLDYLEKESLEIILEKSKEVGIDKIITIAVEPDNFDKVLNLSKQYEQIYFTQGVHPHDAIKAQDHDLKKIEERTAEKKMVAVGEIGLDYHYNHSPRDIQIKRFEEQLDIAIRTNKPVVIHSREADEDMISILKNMSPNLKRKGVIHSFTSTKKLAEVSLDLGFYLGFNGIITFKNAHEVREIVALTPIERILIETDSPFLTPVPHRGKENAPYYLPYVLDKVVEIKEIDKDLASKIIRENSNSLFFPA